jgi:hypothetical protein
VCVGFPEWTAQFSVWQTTGKDSSEACAIACQNCAVYSVFPSGITSHSKIVQFNWECIAPFSLLQNIQTVSWAQATSVRGVQCSWNVMAHGDAWERQWRGNWRMEWVASTLHPTSECGVSSITAADAHTSAASSRLNWRPRRFKWTRPFRLTTKSGFCKYAITFQTQSTTVFSPGVKRPRHHA